MLCAPIHFSPNNLSQDNDAIVQLLKESTTTDDGNKDVLDVDSTSVVLHNTDDPLLVYPFQKIRHRKSNQSPGLV